RAQQAAVTQVLPRRRRVYRKTNGVAWWTRAMVGLATACSGGAQNGVDADQASRGADSNETPVNTSDISSGDTAEPSNRPAVANTQTAGAPDSPSAATSSGAVPAVHPSPTSGSASAPGHAPPTAICEGSLPASFTNACSGCHNVAGTPNDRYPDLYAFDGTLEDFVAKVRNGGNGMAAYP